MRSGTAPKNKPIEKFSCFNRDFTGGLSRKHHRLIREPLYRPQVPLADKPRWMLLRGMVLGVFDKSRDRVDRVNSLLIEPDLREVHMELFLQKNR